jgi:membrane-associated HD superfamily phosphohydrolase
VKYIVKIQYWTSYLESLGSKVFQILGFLIIMQKNFNTDKINNKMYVLRYALSTIHNLFFMRKKFLKSGMVLSSTFKKLVKPITCAIH